jgi:hypothetical protein
MVGRKTPDTTERVRKDVLVREDDACPGSLVRLPSDGGTQSFVANRWKRADVADATVTDRTAFWMPVALRAGPATPNRRLSCAP